MLIQVETWMKSLEKSGLPGKYKAWGYQHGVLPRPLWPLLMYEVPVSTVEGLERKLNTYLRRWLGVPRSFCSIGLSSKGSKLQLPMPSVVEEYKATKTHQAMMLRDSKDERVRQADIVVRTGRKWSASRALREAEDRLHHADIVGSVAQGRLGLGCSTRSSWQQADPKEQRSVQREVQKAEEESRQVKAIAMNKQGRWTKWEIVRERALTWQDIWSMEAHRIKFLLCSVYDVLPTPSNLHTWGLPESPSCMLCGSPANLEHILSSCRSSLADGKFRWRHDHILAQLADGIEQARKKAKQLSHGHRFIHFVRAGQSAAAAEVRSKGVLATASDWEMRADLKKQLKFPEEIAHTSLRPDIVLWSKGTKQVVLIELSVHWEERIEEAHERKLKKYQALILES